MEWFQTAIHSIVNPSSAITPHIIQRLDHHISNAQLSLSKTVAAAAEPQVSVCRVSPVYQAVSYHSTTLLWPNIDTPVAVAWWTCSLELNKISWVNQR